jgi:hypothetical protein
VSTLAETDLHAPPDQPSDASPAAGGQRLASTWQPAGSSPSDGWWARGLATSSVVCVVGGLVSGNPVLVLVAVGAAVTVLLGRWLACDLAVVAAGQLLLLCAVMAGTGAAWLGLDLLDAPSVLGLLYVGLTVFAAVLSWWRPRWVGRLDGRATPLAYLPALVAAATGLFQSVSVHAVQSWAFFGTDVVSHVTILAQVQETGHLDYSLSSYPRGMHMLAALMSVPDAPLDDRHQLLTYDLKLGGALTWLALAFMLWTGSALCLRLGRAVGASGTVSWVAALVFGTAGLLTNTFLESFVVQGAAPSLVAQAVLFCIPLAVLEIPRRRLELPMVAAVAATASMLLAHLWQALAIAPAVALGLLVLVLARSGRTIRTQLWTRRALAGVAVLVAAVVLAADPLFHIAKAGGASLAASPGDLAGEPWRLLIPCLLSTVALTRWGRRPWATALGGTGLGLALTVGWLLRGAGNGLDLDQWYPLKACWFLTLFLAPWLALTVVRLAALVIGPTWARLGRAGRGAFVIRSGVIAIVAATATATWLPWQLGTASALERAWHRYDWFAPGASERPLHHGGALDLVQSVDSRPAIVVPWRLERSFLFEAGSLRVVSDLLHFVNGQPRLAEMTENVCERIRDLSSDEQAVVLTRASAAEVRQDLAEGGCPGRARVVHASIDR